MILNNWEEVQNKYSRIPGKKGVELRKKYYKPYFLRFGKNISIFEDCKFFHPHLICLEDNTRINIQTIIYGSGGVNIGRNVLIGPKNFIHSANHNFQDNFSLNLNNKKYTYLKVKVGSNSLISANCSILPGAEIGENSFVACGSVITNKVFPDNSNIYGVPAKIKKINKKQIKSKNYILKKDLLIVISRNFFISKKLLEFMFSNLGLPQVEVTYDDSKLIKKNKQIIILDPEISKNAFKNNTEVWRTVRFNNNYLSNNLITTETSFYNFKKRKEENVSIPLNIKTYLKINYHPKINHSDRIKSCIYWLKIKLFKANRKFTANEFQDWFTLLIFIYEKGLISKKISLMLLKKILLRAGFPKILTNILLKIKSWKLLKTIILYRNPVKFLLKNNFENFYKYLYAFKYFRTFLFSNNFSDNQKIFCKKFLKKNFNENEPRKLMKLFIISKKINDNSFEKHFDKKLDKKLSKTLFPYDEKNKREIISPLFLIKLLSNIKSSDFSKIIKQDFILTKFNWYHLKNKKLNTGTNCKSISLIDFNKKQISFSLIENWVKLHSCVLPKNKSISLNTDNYNLFIQSVENIWSNFLIKLLIRNNKSAYKINPWPSPYKAAISIRYDVDRELQSTEITQARDIQKFFLNSYCASWFFKDKYNNDVIEKKIELKKFSQEVAYHHESKGRIKANGITFHSSTSADYFRGNQSLLDFNENYKYSEFLYNSIPTIRKGIIYKNKKYFSSKINILPLHYPLESGTDDKSLKYFEQNFKHLKNHLKTSSHVVIATHPDLNKDLLIKLTSKINFDKYWMKPIIEVVERWEKTMEPGNLLMYNDKFGNLFLKSKFNISNLNFEVLDEKQSKSFDLNIKSFDVYNLEKKC